MIQQLQMSQEFPFGPAFKAAMGRVTAFPDGSEAVMIDSALALEAFQQDFQMVIEFMSMHQSPIILIYATGNTISKGCFWQRSFLMLRCQVQTSRHSQSQQKLLAFAKIHVA